MMAELAQGTLQLTVICVHDESGAKGGEPSSAVPPAHAGRHASRVPPLTAHVPT